MRPDFTAHRRRLLDALRPNEAVLLVGSPVRTRNGDTEHRYRPDSDVWWLTGWPDPECAVLVRHGEKPVTMFVQPRDPTAETWTGRRAGPEGAIARYGADDAFPIDALDDELVRLLQGVDTLHHTFGVHAQLDARLQRCVYRAGRAARRNGLDVPELFPSLARLVHELRLHKTDDEIACLREAGRIAALAHTAGMRTGRPGVAEHEVEAAIEGTFRANGADGPGYTSIVAAGDNATILHYVTNDDVIQPGELVLVDAGCEVGRYTSDVTRTWPASGRFSGVQRDVVAAVLEAQELAIAAVKPGAKFLDVHDVAVRRLTQAMIDLGLLAGSVDERIADESYKKYYMHGTSHWLGLDVHDVGAYARNGTNRVLQPGMVLTVEPGLYVAPDDESAPAHLRGIGVRIEDDVLVTATGHDVLTIGCPKALDELEALCS
jgi:Xaa-Pro aminopeptidase